jgi:hypothetical protein
MFFETGSHCVAQADLKFLISLPQPSKCWNYRCAPTHPATLYFIYLFFFTVSICDLQDTENSLGTL